MVLATLAGTKDVTRRTRGLEKIDERPDGWQFEGWNSPSVAVFMGRGELVGKAKLVPCPYGGPGDLLWGRENFYVQPELWAQSHGPQPIHYAADCRREEVEDYVRKTCIFLPKWAARIWRKIVSVRPERLHEITEEEAVREGFCADEPKIWWQGYRELNGDLIHQDVPGDAPPDWMIEPHQRKPRGPMWTAKDDFIRLWDHIDGPGAFDRDDWVWRIESMECQEGDKT